MNRLTNSPIKPVGHSAEPSSEMSEEGQGNAQQVAETSKNTSKSNSVVSGSDKAEQNANEQQDSPFVLIIRSFVIAAVFR